MPKTGKEAWRKPPFSKTIPFPLKPLPEKLSPKHSGFVHTPRIRAIILLAACRRERVCTLNTQARAAPDVLTRWSARAGPALC